jgi:hypothetical protein
LQRGTVNGERIRDTDNVLLFEPGSPNAFLSCTANNCALPADYPNVSGVWDIQIMRGNEQLAAGQYSYDFNMATILTSDIGLETVPYTKQELIDYFVSSHSTKPYRYGIKVFADSAKLLAAFPSAKYASFDWAEMTGTVSSLPNGLSIEELKVGIYPSSYPGYSMAGATKLNTSNPNSRTQIYGMLHLQSDPPHEPTSVNDLYVFMGLYDENFQLIGQYLTVATFDQDHIPDGYAAANNWNPAP